MKKRILSILLVLAILLPLFQSIAPTSSAATYSGTCGDNLTWTFDASTGTLTISGTGEMYNYDDDEYSRQWRYHLSAITTVKINNGVTTIGDYAFSGCKKLETLSIPMSVSYIGEDAFTHCDTIKSVSIPNGVVTIGKAAFGSCDSLKSISISKSVTSIGETAFVECHKLTEIHVDSDNQYYSSDNQGALYDKDKSTLIYCPGGFSGTYVIPDTVTTIGYGAFYHHLRLTGVTFPDSVLTIGDAAFVACSNIDSLTIPPNVTSIGKAAFEDCTGLTSIVLPDGLISIGNAAFRNCSFTNLAIPWSVTTIGSSAFYGCANLVNVTLPDSVTAISDWTFADCDNLAHVTIPSTVTSIGKGAFKYCKKLTSITIPKSVTTIDMEAFASCYYLYTIVISNPSCVIYDDKYTLGYSLSTVIHGYEGSTAETYANNHGYTFAALEDDTEASTVFYENKYIADIYLSRRTDGYYTIETKAITDYLNNTPISSEIVAEMKNDKKFQKAVKTWNGFKSVFDTVEYVGDQLPKEEELYQILILDLVTMSMQNQEKKLNCFLLDSAEAIEKSGEFVSECFDLWDLLVNSTNNSPEGLFALLREASLNPTDPKYAPFYTALEKLSDNGKTLKRWSDKKFLQGLSDIANYTEDVGSFFKLFRCYLSAYDMSDGMVAMLTEMKKHTTNTAFFNTLTKVINSVGNINYAKAVSIDQLAGNLAATVFENIYKELSYQVPIYSQFKLGYDAGVFVSNLLCNTEDTLDSYKLMEATNTFLTVAKNAILSLENIYTLNTTEANAAAYVYAVQTLLHLYKIDLNSALNFIENSTKKGLRNWSRNVVSILFDKEHKTTYGKAVEKKENIIELLSLRFDALINSWKYNEAYLQKDYPNIYPIYVAEDFSTDVFTPSILTLQINPEGKTEVEWFVNNTYTDIEGNEHWLYGARVVTGIELVETINGVSQTWISSYRGAVDRYISYDSTTYSIFPKEYSIRAFTTTQSGKIYTKAAIGIIDTPCQPVELDYMVLGQFTTLLIRDTSFTHYDNIRYCVYRKELGGTFQKITTLPRYYLGYERFTPIVDTTAEDGITYVYKVVSEITFEDGTTYTTESSNTLKVIYNMSTEKGRLMAKVISKKGMADHKGALRSVPDYEVQLTWDAASGADGYEVYRREDYATYSTHLGQVTGTTYIDTTARDDTNYEYYVIPYYMSGEDVVYTDNYSAGELLVEEEEPLDTVIAKNEVEFRINDDEGTRLIRKQETNLGDFCADALYYLFDVTEGLDIDAAIVRSSAIRNTMPIGQVTYNTTKTIHSFGNFVCLIEVTGQQILDALEWGAKNVGVGENEGFLQVSGISYEIHSYIPSTVQTNSYGEWADAPSGEYRVKNVKVGGESLNANKIYRLAGDDFILCNHGNGFTMFDDAVIIQAEVMEEYKVLANYAKSFPDTTIKADNSPLGANYSNINGEGRITIVTDKPADPSDGPIRYAVEGGYLTFDPTTGTITDCDESVTSAVIPEKINGISVKAIGEKAFFNRVKLKNVTIPNGVITIEDWAFFLCTGLEKISIPDSVTTLGWDAIFGLTRLVEIRVSPHNQYFYSDEHGVLYNKDRSILLKCPTTYSGTFVIPDGVTTIEDSAFYFCSKITSLIIPSSVTTIRNGVDCPGLTDVYYTGSEEQWNNIEINEYWNRTLLSATFHYNYDPGNPFGDVKASDYYYAPVLWAVEKGITTGTSANKFSPENPCTRGQIVTFLWRAAGSPEPKTTTNPFSDIKEKDYYYKAVLWAVEQNITTGTGKGKFSPDSECTRAQVATFLWRAQGKPAPTSATNAFSDVAKGAYYYDAVLWAVEKGITNGTGKGKFSPDSSCTRGQIVTFLYRALANN